MKAIKLVSSAMLISTLCATAAFAAPSQLVNNGGFETGTLAGWSTTGLGTGICPIANQEWNVSTTGTATGCTAVADPLGSAFAAYVQNDGTGPLTYKLSQSFGVAAGTTGGAFSFDLSSFNDADSGRTLNVSLTDEISLASVTLYSASTTSLDISWQTLGGDISAFLAGAAGNSVLLSFDNFIPSTWTGPAGLGIDNVSILAEVSTVPEPASLALFGLGLAGLAASRRKQPKN